MPSETLYRAPVVDGEIIRPSQAKFFRYLLVSIAFGFGAFVCGFLLLDTALHIFGGGGALPARLSVVGIVLVGFGFLIALFVAAASFALFFLRNRIILGDEVLQIVSPGLFRTKVDAHLPYRNIAAVQYEKLQAGNWRLGIDFLDRSDPGTLLHAPDLQRELNEGRDISLDDVYVIGLRELGQRIAARCPALRRAS